MLTVKQVIKMRIPRSQVQRHSCYEWKCYSKREKGQPQVCKYGYPREPCDKDLARSTITGRNIYRCEKKEDENLSPCIYRTRLRSEERRVR